MHDPDTYLKIMVTKCKENPDNKVREAIPIFSHEIITTQPQLSVFVLERFTVNSAIDAHRPTFEFRGLPIF